MADSYRTIAAPSEGTYKEKMSRFLAFAHPVTTRDEARAVVDRKSTRLNSSHWS